MFEDYRRYLLSIQNNLIQCGVDMSISEDKSYIDIYRIGCYLDSICYYYKILEITGSKDRLSKFQIPLNGYYMLKMREIFYKEFLDFLEDYNKMSISSSILASNNPKKLLDSSSNTNDIMLKYIQEESLVEPIYQNKYSNNEYSYVEHGRYVEDCSTDKEESYVEHGRYVEDCVIGNKEGYDGSSIIYEESPYDDIVYEDEEYENNENTEEDLSDLLKDEWDDEEDLSDLLNQDYSDEETSDDLYDEFSDGEDLSDLLSQEYSEEEEDSDDEEDLSDLLNEDYEDEDSGDLYDEFSDEEDLSELLNEDYEDEFSDEEDLSELLNEDYEDEFSDEEDLSDLLNDEDDEFNDEEDLSDLLSDEDDLSDLLNEENLSDSSVNGTSTTDKVLNYTNNIGNTAKQTNVRVIPKKDLTDSIYDITGKVLTTGKKAIINGIRKLDN